MKIVPFLIVFLFLSSFVFFLFAFGNAEINPFLWEKVRRVEMAFVLAGCLLISFVFSVPDSKNI